MKIAMIGDLHFGVKNGDESFLGFQLEYMKYFIEECKQRGVEKVIQLGDMLDVRKYTNGLVLHKIINDIIPMIKESGIPWVKVVGNHECPFRETNHVSNDMIFQALHPTGFEVVQDYKEMMIGGKLFAFVGWMNRQNTEMILEKLDKSKADVVCGHFELVDMPMSSTTLATHGLEPDFLEKFEMVVSGHYHCVSQYKSILYTGSPYHLTWSDYPDGTNRGFFIFDTETNDIEMIKNNEHQTMFRMYEYDEEFKYTEEYFKDDIGKIVKFVINKKDDAKAFKLFEKIIKTVQFLDYSVLDNTIVKSVVVEVDHEKLVSDTLTSFKDYIDNQEHTNKNEVKKLVDEYYQQAKGE